MERTPHTHLGANDRARNPLWIKPASLLGALLALVLLLSGPGTLLAANRVTVQLIEQKDHFTDADSVANEEITWNHKWSLFIGNLLDGGGPVEHPVFQFNTALSFSSFNPDDSSIFTAAPPVYTWDFEGVEIDEPAQLGVDAVMEEVTARPRYSVARSVDPVTLVSDVTSQHITVNFTLEESLPAGVNWFMLSIGHPVLAYDYDYPIGGAFVSQNVTPSLPGLVEGTDNVQAWWYGDPSELTVGTTYVFEAVLESTKLEDFTASPIFKPGVAIQWGQLDNHDPMTSNTVTIVHPSGLGTATFTADNVVDWEPASRWNHCILWLSPVISFDVPVPAEMTIKPEVLNLGSRGVITAFVRLPGAYSPSDVAEETVQCQGASPTQVVVSDGQLICKFDRQQLDDLEPGEAVELTLTGQLDNGLPFEATDAIRVVAPGKKGK